MSITKHPINLDLNNIRTEKTKRIFACHGYYEETPEQIERARKFHAHDLATKERIRNQRHG